MSIISLLLQLTLYFIDNLDIQRDQSTVTKHGTANIVQVTDSRSTYLFTKLSCEIQQNLYFSLSYYINNSQFSQNHLRETAEFIYDCFPDLSDHKTSWKYLRIMQASIPHPNLLHTNIQRKGLGKWMLKQLLPFYHSICVRSLGPQDLASTLKGTKAMDPKGLHSATELMEERPNPTFVGDSYQQGNLRNIIPNQ